MKKITAKSLANDIWNNPRNIQDLSTEVIRLTKKCLRVGDLKAFEIGSELSPKVKIELKRRIEKQETKASHSILNLTPITTRFLKPRTASPQGKEKKS